jgi:rod shape-determining protein MreC
MRRHRCKPGHAEQMFKRSYHIAVALVALLTLLVLNLPSRTTTRLKLTLGSIFLPLFGAAGGLQQVAARTGDSLLPKSELIKANEALRRQNDELRLQAMQAAETARENERLRQLVAWQKQTQWKLKLARVLSRDPANWWRTIQIDLGSRDGLRENLPVLTTDGLVGRVAEVSLLRSKVVLIGDANCKVPALVDNEARDKGVIVTSGPFDGSFVSLTYLANNANLKPGQKVVTSDLSAIYPKGIPIGVIADARPVESGLYLEAEVKLSAKLNSLEEVWVLFP